MSDNNTARAIEQGMDRIADEIDACRQTWYGYVNNDHRAHAGAYEVARAIDGHTEAMNRVAKALERLATRP